MAEMVKRSRGHGGNRARLMSRHKQSPLQPTCSGALKSVGQLLGETICRRESPHMHNLSEGVCCISVKCSGVHFFHTNKKESHAFFCFCSVDKKYQVINSLVFHE